MNKEVKEKWVTAMKSGEYEFAAGALRNATNCYCALGVLCDVYQKEEMNRSGWKQYSDATYMFIASDGDFTSVGEIAELPYVVREWAGLTEDQQQTVIELNDHGGTITYDPVVEYLEKL